MQRSPDPGWASYMSVIEVFAQVAAAAFAGFSVLVAIYTFQKSRDRDFLSEFRVSLTDVRSQTQRLDLLLSEGEFSEQAVSVAKEIYYLVGQEGSPRDRLMAVLKENKYTNLVATAIYSGYSQSRLKYTINDTMGAIDRELNKYQDRFPGAIAILRDCVSYITSVAYLLTSPTAMADILVKKEGLEEFLSSMGSFESDEQQKREFAAHLTSISTQGIVHFQGMIDEAKGIMSMLISKMVSLDDAQLSRIIKKEPRVGERGTREAEPIDRVRVRMGSYRGLFSEEEWEEFIRRVDRIQQIRRRMKDEAD